MIQIYRNQWTGPLPLEPRFWSKVYKSDSHWLWQGKRTNKGYGVLAIAGRTMLAHRLAWQFATGKTIPSGMIVGHTCDVPLCVRNDDAGIYEVAGVNYQRCGHLFLATYSANTEDMMAKQRYGFFVHPERRPTGARNGSATHPESVPRGEACVTAKVRAVDIDAIRTRYARGDVRQVDLAAEFGLSQTHVSRIVRGESWAITSDAVSPL